MTIPLQRKKTHRKLVQGLNFFCFWFAPLCLPPLVVICVLFLQLTLLFAAWCMGHVVLVSWTKLSGRCRGNPTSHQDICTRLSLLSGFWRAGARHKVLPSLLPPPSSSSAAAWLGGPRLNPPAFPLLFLLLQKKRAPQKRNCGGKERRSSPQLSSPPLPLSLPSPLPFQIRAGWEEGQKRRQQYWVRLRWM